MGYRYNPFIGNFDRVGPGSGAPAIETLTGNSGGAVGPDGAFNINILGAGSITVTGNPGTNTLTIDDDGTLADTYTADTGSAAPSGGNLNLFGDATQGLSTIGAGDTITFTNLDATESQKGVSELATDAESIAGSDSTRTIVPTSLKAKLGVQTSNAIPFGQSDSLALGWTSALTNGQIVIGASGGNPVAANITPGNGITITNAANFIRIDTTASVATTYTTDSGNAVPVGHILNVLGGTGISTLGAGNTITINLDTPVTEVNGGTNQTTYTQGDILYASAANTLSKLAVGSDGEVLTLASGVPSWAAATAGGKLIQQVPATTSANTSTTTAIPQDNTIPQNTEGAELLTASITPTNPSNRILIEYALSVSGVNQNNQTVAFFVDSTVDAIAAFPVWLPMNSGTFSTSNRFYFTAGSTSARTYKLRYGPISGGTMEINPSIYGGVEISSMTISEIEV